MNFLRKFFHRRTTAAWLSNLSVATMAIGLFQEVSAKLPIIGQVPQWLVWSSALIEFSIANFLMNLDDKEKK